MKAQLLALVLRLIAAQLYVAKLSTLPEPVAYMDGAIDDVLSFTVDPTWTRLLIVWAFHESALRANPPGSNDKGHACGALQVHVDSLPEGWLPPAWTCARLRADRRLGLLAGYIVMGNLMGKCGSAAAGLTAFVSDGQCHKSTYEIVRVRCVEAGLTSECELPKK
jgi:hypothetical protein